MKWSALLWLAVAPGSRAWQPGQVSSIMCKWRGLRGIVLKDTWYVDGGKVMENPQYADGQIKQGVYSPPENAFYTLNFSTAFNVDEKLNVSALFKRVPKLGQSISPSASDGALLGNDFDFFVYGGLPEESITYKQPRPENILRYDAEPYGPPKTIFEGGVKWGTLSGNVSGYVAFGGAANVPSENKAFLFAGMQSPAKGPIFEYNSIAPETVASSTSNALVKLDMTTQYLEAWQNKTLPPSIRPRAGPALVWVPVGSEGILVAIGGVTKPDWNTLSRTSLDATAKESDKSFLTTIDIYDIANDKWYQQSTGPDGPPGPLTQGCAVLAYPDDLSSFNIYYYGGYNGYDARTSFSDSVWVLSLPSFTWTRISEGSPAIHGRAGHVCAQSDPATMFVMGGYVDLSVQQRCLSDVLTVFNLTSGRWLTGYDPANYTKYGVHPDIYAKIGGSGAGGATQKAPVTSWSNSSLAILFTSRYQMDKIPRHYPYAPAPVVNNTNPDFIPPNNGGGNNGLPSFVAPLLGVVLGLMLLTAIGVGILLYKRRKLLRGKEGSVVGTEDQNGHRILSWIRGQPSEVKTAPTVTTAALDEPPRIISPEPPAPVVSTPSPEPYYGSYYGRQELGDTQLAEMLGDTTHTYAELSDTGLSPVDIVNHHSMIGRRLNASGPSTLYSGSHADHASSVSRATDPPAAAPGPAAYDGRADSPPLGTLGAPFFQPMMPDNASQQPLDDHSVAEPSPPIAQVATPPPAQAGEDARIVSGLSGMSERDRAHLRQTSDTSVATVSSLNTARRGLSPEPLGPAMAAAASASTPAGGSTAPTSVPEEMILSPQTALSPDAGPLPPGMTPPAVSPPTPGQLGEGEDYITPRRSAPMSPGAVSAMSPHPQRRSAFHENEEDLDDLMRRP